jgi:hypothetical protein
LSLFFAQIIISVVSSHTFFKIASNHLSNNLAVYESSLVIFQDSKSDFLFSKVEYSSSKTLQISDLTQVLKLIVSVSKQLF